MHNDISNVTQFYSQNQNTIKATTTATTATTATTSATATTELLYVQ
jgi:hypothetical protein